MTENGSPDKSRPYSRVEAVLLHFTGFVSSLLVLRGNKTMFLKQLTKHVLLIFGDRCTCMDLTWDITNVLEYFLNKISPSRQNYEMAPV